MAKKKVRKAGKAAMRKARSTSEEHPVVLLHHALNSLQAVCWIGRTLGDVAERRDAVVKVRDERNRHILAMASQRANERAARGEPAKASWKELTKGITLTKDPLVFNEGPELARHVNDLRTSGEKFTGMGRDAIRRGGAEALDRADKEFGSVVVAEKLEEADELFRHTVTSFLVRGIDLAECAQKLLEMEKWFQRAALKLRAAQSIPLPKSAALDAASLTSAPKGQQGFGSRAHGWTKKQLIERTAQEGVRAISSSTFRRAREGAQIKSPHKGDKMYRYTAAAVARMLDTVDQSVPQSAEQIRKGWTPLLAHQSPS